MIPSSGRLVAASSGQEAGLQSGPPQPVGTVRRLVLPSAERSVRWEALSRRHRRHGTADLIPDRSDGLAAHWPNRRTVRPARAGVVTDHADAKVPGNEFTQRILFRAHARGGSQQRCDEPSHSELSV
jgi:hypothetical protein